MQALFRSYHKSNELRKTEHVNKHKFVYNANLTERDRIIQSPTVAKQKLTKTTLLIIRYCDA